MAYSHQTPEMGGDRNINNEERFKHNTHSSCTKNPILHTQSGNFLAWFNLVEKSGNNTEHQFFLVKIKIANTLNQYHSQLNLKQNNLLLTTSQQFKYMTIKFKKLV